MVPNKPLIARSYPGYRFGDYELRTRTRELYKCGIKLKLRPQPFRVLEVLAEHAGDAVTREELRAMLWPAETFVDFEHGLNTSVKELRKVLNDSPGEPRYIETLPKLGYRMIVAVESIGQPEPENPPDAEVDTQPDQPIQQAQPPVGKRVAWPKLLAASVLLMAILGFGLIYRIEHKPPMQQRLILAVLPFDNLTGDSSQEYLSDGLTEEMVAQLGKLNSEQFSVIARTSAMRYKHSQKSLKEIGSDLNAQYVLEGSLRRDAGSVRVSAQLIRVSDETPTWSRQYDRSFTSLLVLEDEIAREISDELQVILGKQKPARSILQATLSPQRAAAYDLYLKGLYLWNKRTIDGMRQAIQYYEQAISKDPSYAAPYAGLADCYAMIGGYSGQPLAEYIVKARTAALRALQLDETLAEAHTALAVVVQNYDWDWQTAGREYQRAIELNPNYAMAHHWYAEHLGYLGRFSQAFEESERARQLDPLSTIIAADNAVLLYYARRYEESIRKFRSVREIDPGLSRANQIIKPYVEQGNFQQALAVMERGTRLYGDQPFVWFSMAYIYGRAGRRSEAQQALKKLEAVYQPQSDDEAFVFAYLGLADKEKCMAWLEKAYSQHSNVLTTLRVDPAFDPLRSDSRFQSLLHRVGL